MKNTDLPVQLHNEDPIKVAGRRSDKDRLGKCPGDSNCMEPLHCLGASQ
jgi:hypothetical protein